MSGVTVYILLVIGLFVASFLTRRRIGAPILGLAAGATLSGILAEPTAEWLAQRGGQVDMTILDGSVAVVMVLAPAALLMMHGHLHKSSVQRLGSAFLFMIIALAFIVEPLGQVINPYGRIDGISEFLLRYQDTIIAIGLLLAIVDLVFTKLHKAPLPKKGKH